VAPSHGEGESSEKQRGECESMAKQGCFGMAHFS
jgi:hypothetical protein